MTIFDDARAGSLVGTRLKKLDSTDLNSQDPATGWTLLATAVVAGLPKQVEELLKNGADATLACRDDETPLLLAAWKTPKERALIVQKLLAYVPKNLVDETCALAEWNTPLMWAIKKLDVDSVRLLAKAGARLSIKNADGFNAHEVAASTGRRAMTNALEPDKEQSKLARLAGSVVAVIRHAVAWINDKVKDFMEKKFGFKGQRDKSLEERLKKRQSGTKEPTVEEFIDDFEKYVKETPMLNTFFKGNPEFIQDMAKNAAKLASDPTTDLCKPEVLAKTIPVTMHQQVIYCDDSGSMVNQKGTKEGRWDNQKNLVLRIARSTTRILPEGYGVGLCFINRTTDESPAMQLTDLKRVLDTFDPTGDTRPAGDTPIGTKLKERILTPLVYDPLAAGTLKRPLLVSILTDGAPSKEVKGPGQKDKDVLASVILECGNELKKKDYPRDSVKFLIGQIGTSNDAVEFLDTLNKMRDENPDIAKVMYVHAGRFDDKFKSFRDERGLDRWLIETLFKPLAATATGDK